MGLRSLSSQDSESFDVVEASIEDIHHAMRSGGLSCRQLTQTYLDRIAELDQSSRLNAIVVVNPHALQRADELDREYSETGELLALHGIGVIVKDNYDTSDLPTTAGSKCLKDSLPPDDAWQVRKLREAGAIVLGKSNMAEFAFSPYDTVSSIAGVTRNPYDLSRVPAGSSGGTAAAVAANLGTVGLGTDTGNSIRGPASHCCLVGIRPTLGLTSRDGIVPLYLRNDVGGPMCRTVKDAARILEVIAGPDLADPVTELSREKGPFRYSEPLDASTADSLRGARIGVFRTLSDTSTTDAHIQQLFEKAIADLKEQGAVIIDPFAINGLNREQLAGVQRRLWQNTFRRDIARYLESLGPDRPVSSLREILGSKAFHSSIRDRLTESLRSKVPSELKRPSSADPADDPVRLALLQRVVSAMDEARIEAFIYPTWNNPPRKVGDLNSPHGNNSYQIPPHTGQPAITVPMGFTESGLPAGLQFVGRRFDEATLFCLAYAYEQATQHRQVPATFSRQPNDRN